MAGQSTSDQQLAACPSREQAQASAWAPGTPGHPLEIVPQDRQQPATHDAAGDCCRHHQSPQPAAALPTSTTQQQGQPAAAQLRVQPAAQLRVQQQGRRGQFEQVQLAAARLKPQAPSKRRRRAGPDQGSAARRPAQPQADGLPPPGADAAACPSWQGANSETRHEQRQPRRRRQQRQQQQQQREQQGPRLQQTSQRRAAPTPRVPARPPQGRQLQPHLEPTAVALELPRRRQPAPRAPRAPRAAAAPPPDARARTPAPAPPARRLRHRQSTSTSSSSNSSSPPSAAPSTVVPQAAAASSRPKRLAAHQAVAAVVAAIKARATWANGGRRRGGQAAPQRAGQAGGTAAGAQHGGRAGHPQGAGPGGAQPQRKRRQAAEQGPQDAQPAPKRRRVAEQGLAASADRPSGRRRCWRVGDWERLQQEGLSKLVAAPPPAPLVTQGGGRKRRAAAAEEQGTPATAAAGAAAAAPLAQPPPATAVLLLLHGPGCVNADCWDLWAANHDAGDVAVFCHLKQGVNLGGRRVAGSGFIARTMLSTRVDAKWGDTSLVEAFLDGLAEVMQRCDVPGTWQQLVQGSPPQKQLGGEQQGRQQLPAGQQRQQQQQEGLQLGRQQKLRHSGDGGQAGVRRGAPGTAASSAAASADTRGGAQATAAAAGHDAEPCSATAPQPAPSGGPASSSAGPREPLPGAGAGQQPPAEALGPTGAAGAAAALEPAPQECPPRCGLQHVLLASGHDVPLRLLRRGLLPAGVTVYGSYDYPADVLAELRSGVQRGMLAAGFAQAEARHWAECLAPHHQWLCVSVEHALALVALRDSLLKVARAVHRAWRADGCGIAADEWLVVTALRAAGCIRALRPCRRLLPSGLQPGVAANCHPTQVMYAAPVPAILLDEHARASRAPLRTGAAAASEPPAPDKHPVTWTTLDGAVWCEEEEGGEQYATQLTLQSLLSIAAGRGCLVLRKVDLTSPPGGDYATGVRAQDELLKLLQRLWGGERPKVPASRRVRLAAADEQSGAAVARRR